MKREGEILFVAGCMDGVVSSIILSTSGTSYVVACSILIKFVIAPISLI